MDNEVSYKLLEEKVVDGDTHHFELHGLSDETITQLKDAQLEHQRETPDGQALYRIISFPGVKAWEGIKALARLNTLSDIVTVADDQRLKKNQKNKYIYIYICCLYNNSKVTFIYL